MKFHTMVFALAALSPLVLSTPFIDAATECGDLGVMTWDANSLPQNADLSDLRKCHNHPLGSTRPRELVAPIPSTVDAKRLVTSDGTTGVDTSLTGRAIQDCEFGAPYGCSKGYCWKVCGSGGKWCWTAANGGIGAWDTCASQTDCGTQLSCGQGCGKSCGCSC